MPGPLRSIHMSLVSYVGDNVVGQGVGCRVGAKVGSSVGVRVVGADVGASVVGALEGTSVGSKVGMSVGAEVGASVGAMDGISDGASVVGAVGDAEGAELGAEVGASVVGAEEGARVGATEGARVGATEGAEEGAIVGASVLMCFCVERRSLPHTYIIARGRFSQPMGNSGQKYTQLSKSASNSCADLQTLNWIALATHSAVGVAALVVAIVKRGDTKCVPITQTYNAARPGTGFNSTDAVLLPGPGLCYAYLAFAFEVVCAAAHANILWNEDAYEALIRDRVNPWRFAEYAVSASIMLMAVSSTAGVSDFSAQMAFVACNVGCMACGHLSELLNPNIGARPGYAGWNAQWTPFGVGALLQAVPWTCVFYAYGLGAARLNPPWIVTAVVVQLFLFFNCFALVEALWLAGKGIKSYRAKEWWYTVLSLTSKVSLAGMFVASAFMD